MVHVISYDLVGPYRPPDDYARLEQAIRDISGVYLHFQKSEWLVETELPTGTVYNRLTPHITGRDRLMVHRVQRDWTAWGLTQEEINWLNGRNFGSLIEAMAGLFPLLPKTSPVGPYGALVAAIMQKP